MIPLIWFMVGLGLALFGARVCWKMDRHKQLL
jgi:hypothetical protein